MRIVTTRVCVVDVMSLGLNVTIRLNILAATENILLSYNYCTVFRDVGRQAGRLGSRAMKVIYRSVSGMDAHAHAGDVDRVPPYVCLERHCRGCRWMGE